MTDQNKAARAPEGGRVSGRVAAGEFLPDSVQSALATCEEPPAEAELDPATVTLEWSKIETLALEEWRAEFGDYVALATLGHDSVWSYRVNNSGHLGFASGDEAKSQALAALKKRLSARLAAVRATVALYDAAALATREEAPADHVTDAREMVEAPAEAGERDYPAEFETWWATYRHRNRDVADYPVKKQIAFDAFYHAALRAQPPAREDAQPVGYCCPEHLSRIKREAEARGEASSVIYGYPAGTYRTPLYTHPAPDALRVAVEALEPFAAACFDRESQNVKTLPGGASVRVTLAQCRAARKALAALQAEQKGGA